MATSSRSRWSTTVSSDPALAVSPATTTWQLQAQWGRVAANQRREQTGGGVGIEKEPLDGRLSEGHETIRLPPSAEAALHAARTSSMSSRDIHSVSNSSPSAR